jgi:hypothetical protein
LIAYVRHEARCNALADPKDPSKGTNREWWRAAARKGRPDAVRALQGPPYPTELDYLYRWALALHGRSGVGMTGVAPLSPVVVESWARQTHRRVDAMEFDALMLVDAALRAPVDMDEPPTTGTVESSASAWPTKKASG